MCYQRCCTPTSWVSGRPRLSAAFALSCGSVRVMRPEPFFYLFLDASVALGPLRLSLQNGGLGRPLPSLLSHHLTLPNNPPLEPNTTLINMPNVNSVTKM